MSLDNVFMVCSMSWFFENSALDERVFMIMFLWYSVCAWFFKMLLMNQICSCIGHRKLETEIKVSVLYTCFLSLFRFVSPLSQGKGEKQVKYL